MTKKLTPKQKEIIQQMRDGKQLYLKFGFSIKYAPTYYIGDTRQNVLTIESLKNSELIQFAFIEKDAFTRHYYKLTQLGQTIEL